MLNGCGHIQLSDETNRPVQLQPYRVILRPTPSSTGELVAALGTSCGGMERCPTGLLSESWGAAIEFHKLDNFGDWGSGVVHAKGLERSRAGEQAIRTVKSLGQGLGLAISSGTAVEGSTC